MLAPPSLEGTQHLLRTLREWIQRIEEQSAFRASSYSWQIVQAVPMKGESMPHHTGAAEWHLKALVGEPVPAEKRVDDGREYA